MRKPTTKIGGRALALAARLDRDERGATAIEYALIAGTVSIGIIVSLRIVGVRLNDLLTSIAAAWPF